MASTPLILNGVVTDIDETNLADTEIIAINSTSSGSAVGTTNSSGQYLIDLANFKNDYAVGDVIYVEPYTSGRWPLGRSQRRGLY